MSLQLAAQHLSHKGRGPDDMLVHMSSREVKSLSDLAQAHGGQLTINPHTGLPEAGVLDKLLPTLIGAGITYFSGGTISPAMIGLGVGGFEALRSGSLEKGLMAGLGAYGGAGLTGGLMSAGVGAMGAEANNALAQNAAHTSEAAFGNQGFGNAALQNPSIAGASNYDKLSAGAGELFQNPGKVVDAMGGGFNTAKYAAGAAAPYLASALKPNVDMPSSTPKPTEYRQYKVNRRPDLSYEYTALPVSNTFTPNFAEGGGISELVNPYLDPSFKFKNVGGPPRVSTATEMPTQHMAEGGRITPEEFYQQYMQQGQTPTNLQYSARGYPDTAPATPKTPYETVKPTPADIIGVDGETYSWDAASGKYVTKPKEAKIPTSDTGNAFDRSSNGSGDPTGAKQAEINARFDAMSPQEKADHAETNAAINNGLSNVAKAIVALTPLSTIANVVNMNKNIDKNAEALAPLSLMASKAKEGLQLALSPLAMLHNKLNPRKGEPAPVENKDTLSEAAQAEADGMANGFTKAIVTVGGEGEGDGSPSVSVAPSVTSVNDGSGTVGSGMGYTSSSGPGGFSAPSGPSGEGIGSPGSVGIGMGFTPSTGPGGFSAPGPGGEGSPGTVGGGMGSTPSGGPGGFGGYGGGFGGNAGSSGSVGSGMGSTPSTGPGGFGGGTGGMATGGLSDAHYNLGGYSDGGRLLRGPGDGVSDSIPATIGHKQPARLADGEFVVPARIVSEIGNGSTEAGARKLYAMMDRIQKARAQTVGKGRVAKNTRAEKYLPA
jgi:hypothetical protein